MSQCTFILEIPLHTENIGAFPFSAIKILKSEKKSRFRPTIDEIQDQAQKGPGQGYRQLLAKLHN